MTWGGGRPHAVGYAGQEFKATVFDSDLGKRRTIGWSTKPFDDETLRSLETRPGWSDAKNEIVTDRGTGA